PRLPVSLTLASPHVPEKKTPSTSDAPGTLPGTLPPSISAGACAWRRALHGGKNAAAPAASSASVPPAVILKGPYNVWSDARSWFRQFLRQATVVAAHHARQRTAHRAHPQQMPAVSETAAAAPHA